MKKGLVIVSIYLYGFLPFSLVLLNEIEAQRHGVLLLYILMEQMFLFCLLNIGQTLTTCITLCTACSYFHMVRRRVFDLMSDSGVPSLLFLALETYSVTSMVSIAARISQASNRSHLLQRQDTHMLVFISLLQLCSRLAASWWAYVPVLELLNPSSDISSSTFYKYGFFLLIRLAINNFLIPIIGITVNGEKQVLLCPGAALDLSVIRWFSAWNENGAWFISLMSVKTARNYTWDMLSACVCMLVFFPVIYAPRVLLSLALAALRGLLSSEISYTVGRFLRFCIQIPFAIISSLVVVFLSVPLRIISLIFGPMVAYE